MALLHIGLTLTQAFLLSLSSLITWYLASTLISWYKLRHVQGPILASFSWLWLLRVTLSGSFSWVCSDLRKKYGSLVRIAPNMLMTDDPEVMRKMAATQSRAWKDPWYDGTRWDPHHKFMFNLLDPESHDRVKAKISRAYSGREVEALEAGVDAQLETLLDLIRRKYLYKPLEFAHLTSYFTLDVITKLTLGKPMGYLSTDSDMYDLLEMERRHLPFNMAAADIPWFRSIVYSPLFLKLFGPKPTDPNGIGLFMRVFRDFTAKRFEPGAQEQKDILGSFVRSGISQMDCYAETMFAMMAGSETSASAIRMTMLCLMASPLVYHKFKGIIAEVIREGKSSSPITYDEARNIPYLRAIVYEGLRMRPPAQALFPKVVPPEGDVIDGKRIPGGTPIAMNFGAMARSAAHFGPDADEFRPERFTEADATRRAEMERIVELVFGYGRWMCAGKPVAFLELHKVFFELLRNFDFQLINPSRPWRTRHYGTPNDTDFWVKVTESNLT
ncbi:BcABA1, cytochrome P450 monooxygenase [Xylariaceae sp. FL0662B]|nr:BcABA1, cytochrome P450 monooxygenase [Xylariaceae sp. FL0662B]